MASMTTEIKFSAEKLFDMCKDLYEEDLHELLRSEIQVHWPDGISVPVTFKVGKGQYPTRH